MRLIVERSRDQVNGAQAYRVTLYLKRDDEEKALHEVYGTPELHEVFRAPGPIQELLNDKHSRTFATPEKAYEFEAAVRDACKRMNDRILDAEEFGGREVYDF